MKLVPLLPEQIQPTTEDCEVVEKPFVKLYEGELFALGAAFSQ